MRGHKLTSAEIYARTKDIVDCIYELTIGDGYTGSLIKGMDDSLSAVVLRYMKVRGVVICTTPPKNNKPHYIWNKNAMKPNDTFYKSITRDIMDFLDRKNVKKEEGEGVVQKKEAVTVQEIIHDMASHTLETFSDKELWDELKRRGARIVDNKLKIVKEYELD